MTGAVLGGRYRLTRPIGSGGMAVVWEARDEILGREVAVKVLAGQHLGDPQSRELIRHEARAAAALSHPNIAQVHDYGETTTADGVFPFVVMELIRGETLLERASRSQVLPRFAMRVCAEVAAALAAAHSEGIVHRDVKPANVMLAPTGAKVVDFGIAAAVAPGRTDEDFEVLGTPAYLAPERLISDVVEPASDVYALAILLYQLLAGCLPWSSETTTQMLTAHIYVDPEPLGPTDGVPDYVVDLCNRCLAKDPTLRPSAREVAAVLAHGARAKVAIDDLDDPSLSAPSGPLPMYALLGEAPDGPSASSAAEGGSPAAEDGSPAALGAAGNGHPVEGAPAGPRHAYHDPGSATAAGQPDGPHPGDSAVAGAALVGAGSTGSARRAGAPAADGAPGSRDGEDPAPGRRRRSALRRWLAAAAAIVVLLLAGALLLRPRGGSHGSPATAGGPAVRWQSAPAGAPGSTAASPVGSVLPGGAIRTMTVPPTHVSAPAAAAPGAPETAGTLTATVTAHPTTTAPATAPATSASPTTRQLSSSGGSVEASCPDPSTARILSAEPARSFHVDSVDTDPGPAPAAVFKHGNERVTMTITCQGGVPSQSTSG